MLEGVDCTGAPRDLGVAQGEAFRNAVRDHVARSGATLRGRGNPVLTALRPWASGSVLGAGAGREIIRHYPHLAERMAGVAQGAGLPVESLVASLGQPAASSLAALTAAPIAVAAEAIGEAGAFAARTLAPSVVPGARWITRRSRPEVGFPSVEVTLPWLASALAGVNSEGLAVLMARSDAISEAGAPPLLMVQECLQRFASVDGCLDWCLKRSSFGRALLFIAQAEGGVAAVEFDGGERRVVRPSDGLLSEGVSPAALAELRKARERHPDPPFEADSLDWVGLGALDAGPMIVHLDPASRRLSVESAHREDLTDSAESAESAESAGTELVAS